MRLGNERGGGGIVTNPGDLLLWNEALTTNRLGAFVTAKLHEPTTLNNGRKLDWTRGLILTTHRGIQEVGYTGSARGYKSYLGRFPEHNISIAIMCNSGDETDRRGFAHRIVERLVPEGVLNDRIAETDGPPPVPPAEVEVNRLAGIFINDEAGDLLHLIVDRGMFRIAGGPGLEFVEDQRFRRWGTSTQYMSGDAFELIFQSADLFEMISMEGRRTTFGRVMPYAPTADELQALAGRYESDEIGSVLVIESPKANGAEGGLVLRLEHSPGQTLQFKPIQRDIFQFSRMTVRFCRDEQGGVLGLDYSNPVLRKVRFARRR